MTALRVVGADTPAAHRQRVTYSLEELAKQADRPGPKFVFAHIMSPHDPFVFGPEGEPRFVDFGLFENRSESENEAVRVAYRDQLQYVNRRMMQVIDQILTRSQRPPVIILHGDHGLRMLLGWEVADSCLSESTAILNAYYLPERTSGGQHVTREQTVQVPESISPVNSFRLVFDTYFGTQLGLLDDRVYFAHRSGIWNFVDVTDVAETCNVRD